jgi:hypothetical protein
LWKAVSSRPLPRLFRVQSTPPSSASLAVCFARLTRGLGKILLSPGCCRAISVVRGLLLRDLHHLTCCSPTAFSTGGLAAVRSCARSDSNTKFGRIRSEQPPRLPSQRITAHRRWDISECHREGRRLRWRRPSSEANQPTGAGGVCRSISSCQNALMHLSMKQQEHEANGNSSRIFIWNDNDRGSCLLDTATDGV